ncbi:MAG: hypothetical protein AAB368_02955, partial [bacterium]
RRIAAVQEANALRSGQATRGIGLTGAGTNAGRSAYDILRSGTADVAGALGDYSGGRAQDLAYRMAPASVYDRIAGYQTQANVGNARNALQAGQNMLPYYASLANAGIGLAGAGVRALKDSDWWGKGGTGDLSYSASGGDPSGVATAGNYWTGAGEDLAGSGVADYASWGDSAKDIDWSQVGNYYMSRGGDVPGRGSYDTVRAMLTPQEFVVRRPFSTKALPALKHLNAGHFGAAARDLAKVARVAR